MDWTWAFDEWVPKVVGFGALGGALVTFVLSFTLGVWLLARGAGNPGWARLPRVLCWLGSCVGRAVGAALVLLVWDGLYLSRDWLSLGIVVGFVTQLLLAVVAFLARRGLAVRAHVAAAGVWVVVLFAVAGFSRFNLRLAEARSQTVIAACRQFERDHGRLPIELEELVPGYLPRLPRADWTLLGDFRYAADEGVALGYFHPWPWMRIYTFDDDKWWWDRAPVVVGEDDEDEVRAAAAAGAGDTECQPRHFLSPVSSEAWLVAVTTAALAVLKLYWVRRAAPDLLPKKVAWVLGLHTAVILGLPVAAAHLASARVLSPVVLYGLWWTTAALPLARNVLRDATQAQAGDAPRAHALWTWMPCALVLLHLWSIGYIHTLDLRAAFLTPLFLGLALAVDRRQQALKLVLPGLAVLMSLAPSPDLSVRLLGSDALSASPLRLALVGVGLVWLYLGWRDDDRWLMALPIGGAVVYLLGPHAGWLARAMARWLAVSVPRDRFGWGALTVIAAFVLLAAGARRSLHGEPRWPGRLTSARGGARGEHA